MNQKSSEFDRSRYILLVENKTNDLFYVSMLLQRFDYRVCSANTVPDALEMISVALPVLIMSDLSLPGLTGIDLLHLLKQETQTREVPLIMFVRDGDMNAETRCCEAGAVAVISKPVRAEELYRKVQATIELVPRSNIRIHTKALLKINNIPLDCIDGECATVLSEHGMYIRMVRPHTRNEQVAIEMNLNGRLIPIDASVLYSHRFGEGPFKEPGMGLKFTRIASEDLEFIKRFISDQVNRGLTPPGSHQA